MINTMISTTISTMIRTMIRQAVVVRVIAISDSFLEVDLFQKMELYGIIVNYMSNYMELYL